MRDLTRLELVTEAVRAALEELARTADYTLEGLAGDDWGRRYGRPVRLGKNPARPKTRINEAGADARLLLEHLAASYPGLLLGPRVEALRQVMVQNCYWDVSGRLCAGATMTAIAGCRRRARPYRLALRPGRPLRPPGTGTRWTGYLAHMTETCSDDGPNVITDVATMPATSADTAAVAGIHSRLERRGLLAASTWSMAATPPWSTWSGPGASTRSPSPGRCPATAPASTATSRATPATTSASTTTARKSPARKARSAKGGTAPTPTSSPDAAPLIVARFTKGQCQPCPVRAACTTSGDGKRTVGFPPRELYELQIRNRADQQDPAWHKRYAVRSGIEGTVCELANGHGMRHCRYRGQPKAHVQHVLTAIAVNIERLSQLPSGENPAPRPPTAFQDYLDQHDIKRLRSWRAVS